MTNDYLEEQRHGNREPRSKLLPPYLQSNPYFKDFADAIDRVWAEQVDSRIDVIKYLRHMWVTNPTVERKIDNGELLDLDDWTRPERSLLVKQVNLLGMKLRSAGLLTDQNYLVVSRFLGRYWFGKGTEDFIQFINFALILDLEVRNLWSEILKNPDGSYQLKYNNFTREEDAGTPIWEGGNWFPTTHVEIVANGGLSDISTQTLAEFFYEIANYNLVLRSVDADYKMPIVPDVNTPVTRVVANALVANQQMVMSNTGRYGIAPPKSYTFDGLPTQVYGTGEMLLGRPDTWWSDSTGKKFPVFLRYYKITDGVELPTTLIGEPTSPGDPLLNYKIMRSSPVWSTLPGSPRMTGLIPGWSSIPAVTYNPVIPTVILGHRDSLLSNPVGFVSLGGNFVPYW